MGSRTSPFQQCALHEHFPDKKAFIASTENLREQRQEYRLS